MPVPATVGTIMTRRVMTVSPDDPVRRVRTVFDTWKFRHLIVVEHGRVVGVISDRDLLRHLSPFVGTASERAQDAHTLDRRVHQIMTRPLITCTEQTPAAEAARLMLRQRVSCLPVLGDGGRCVGIITVRDVMAWALTGYGEREGSIPVRRAA